MALIISRAIGAKSEGFLLNALRTAPLSFRHTGLESIIREPVVIDPSAADEIPLDQYRWEAEGFEDGELDDDEEEDDDEDEETDDEDEDEDDEDEEEEPPLYVAGGKLHSDALGSTTSSTAAAGPAQ